MPLYGRKKLAAEPLLENLEVHLQQIVSSATAALRILKITKRNFTALRQVEADTSAESQLSNLTDSQVLSKNLLEAVRLVGDKAVATAATAERAIISQKESRYRIGTRHSPVGTAHEQGPSSKTQRRKNLRDARKLAERASNDPPDITTEATITDCIPPPNPKSARSATTLGNMEREITTASPTLTPTETPVSKNRVTVQSDIQGKSKSKDEGTTTHQTIRHRSGSPIATSKPLSKSQRRQKSSEPSKRESGVRNPSSIS